MRNVSVKSVPIEPSAVKNNNELMIPISFHSFILEPHLKKKNVLSQLNENNDKIMDLRALRIRHILLIWPPATFFDLDL